MRIAGGMFGLEWGQDAGRPEFMRDPKLLLLSVRCGIQSLVESLKPPQVWMPSYLCCAMLEAVDPDVTELKFYEVGYDLEIVSGDWLDRLLPGSLVILIDYFGFPCDSRIAREVQARDAFVLEDASQALLSTHVGRQGDFVLYSPRKTVGVPDGGILRSLNGNLLPGADLLAPPRGWWLQALEACIERREFDRFGGDRRWFELFQHSEQHYPLGFYRMSELSEMLLEGAFDYEAIAQARRANYTHLADALADYSIFRELDADTVPLGFPIRVRNRDEVRQALFAESIYPPVHWELHDYVPGHYTESHRLSGDIMTIPCDQRLGLEDMTRIADLLHSILDRPHWKRAAMQLRSCIHVEGEEQSPGLTLARDREKRKL